MTDQPAHRGGFSVRHAGAEELPRLRALADDIFKRDFAYAEGHQLVMHHPDPLDPDDFDVYFAPQRRHALFIATDDATGEIIGMAGLKRVRGGLCPGAPSELVERLDRDSTAEIVRVYIDREHRRRGVGRALVSACRTFAESQPGYTTLYCHTDARYPEAPRFWSTIGTLLHDARADNVDDATLFFEIPLRGS